MAGKKVWNRREALGFAAATVAAAGCKPAAREQAAAVAPAGIANLNTAIEVAKGARGGLQLTALRNRHSKFDWLAGAQDPEPRVSLSQEPAAAWQVREGQLGDGGRDAESRFTGLSAIRCGDRVICRYGRLSLATDVPL